MLWTGSGVQETFATPPADSKLSLCLDKPASDDGNSPPLPGALFVDPFVRSAAQQEGLKVAENAVWLVMVGMREYVKSVMKNTLTSVKSINGDNELPDPTSLIGSIGPVAKDRASAFEPRDSMKLSTAAAPAKRKCISALDLASYLMASPVARGRDSNRIAFEQCYMSAFDPLLVTSHRGFDSLQRYIASGIDTSKPKKQRTDKDPSFFPPATKAAVPSSPAQPQKVGQEKPMQPSQSQAMDKKVSQADTLPPAKAATSKVSATVKPPHPTSMRRSPSIRGMGRGAKNLAALKARAAAAAASAAKDDDAQNSGGPIGSQEKVSTNTQVTPSVESVSAVSKNDAAQPEVPNNRKSEATQPPPLQVGNQEQSSIKQEQKTETTVAAVAVTGSESSSKPVANAAAAPAEESSVGDSTQPEKEASTAEAAPAPASAPAGSGSAQARRGGRGFGTKNLAMMRARSTGTADESSGGGGSQQNTTENATRGTPANEQPAPIDANAGEQRDSTETANPPTSNGEQESSAADIKPETASATPTIAATPELSKESESSTLAQDKGEKKVSAPECTQGGTSREGISPPADQKKESPAETNSPVPESRPPQEIKQDS